MERNIPTGIEAVAFDVFGTLVRITDYRRPYHRLLDLLEIRGRRRALEDAAIIMSTNIELTAVPGHFGYELPPDLLLSLQRDLEAELRSIQLYEDAAAVIQAVKRTGYKVGLCSNLASPYATPVRELIRNLDAYVWSFETGAVKPDSRIYERLCSDLGSRPGAVLRVGDTVDADYAGPLDFGMHALHLHRTTSRQMAGSISSLSKVLHHLGIT